MIKTKFTGVYYRDLQNKDRVFIITYKLRGKSKKEKVGTAKEGVTAAYASKIRAKRTSVDRLKEDAPMLQNKKLPTFDECFNLYMNKIKEKSDTRNTKGRYDLHVKKTFGHLVVDEITIELLENFRQKARKKISQRTGRPYAAKTINDWLNIVGTVINYMIIHHNLNIKNVAYSKTLEREKIDNDRERYLEIDEIEKLWDVLENRTGAAFKEYVTANMKIFLALSLSTGARLNSVLTITKSDINFQQNTIRIKNHKSNRTYNGFLHPRYKTLIEERVKNLSPIDYVVNGKNKPLSRVSPYKVFKKVFDDCFNQDLEPGDSKRRVVIHTLRHTFASQLAIQGTPIYTIMRLMDHADISQTIR
ncbi:site-specific integrase, partial [Sulfurimonas sp.]|uniref:tyrosine-type recombinase/integrase n=1 Tax=Sulfurimonas sp. TaxID=2022749 RepID=UPI0025FA8B6E